MQEKSKQVEQKIIGVSDVESDVYDYWIEIPKID